MSNLSRIVILGNLHTAISCLAKHQCSWSNCVIQKRHIPNNICTVIEKLEQLQVQFSDFGFEHVLNIHKI